MLPLALTQIAQLARPSVVQIRADDAVDPDSSYATTAPSPPTFTLSPAPARRSLSCLTAEIDDIEVLAADADHDLVLLRGTGANQAAVVDPGRQR